MTDTINIVYIGDVIGKPGRRVLTDFMPTLLKRYSPDMIIANGENAAGGCGITPEVVAELRALGVDVITSGNHIWDKRDIIDYIDGDASLLRPLNFPADNPGRGSFIFETPGGVLVGVINLVGRVFMPAHACPFTTALAEVEIIRQKTPIIIIDFHAEATSEKNALGHYLDGQVSAVIGSHTHVQTSDERVLGAGTAYLTDGGMTGPVDSVIGVEKDVIIRRFLSGMPERYGVAKKGLEVQGACVTVDSKTGRAVGVERIKHVAI
jgi:hypothetical protein